MSGGSREEGFAALLTVITEANEQGDWPGFVTPNFTTGTAIYARLFREVFSGATRRGLDYRERGRLVPLSAPARILNCVNADGTSRSPATIKDAAGVCSCGVFDLKMLRLRSSGILPVKLCPQSTEIRIESDKAGGALKEGAASGVVGYAIQRTLAVTGREIAAAG